MNESQTSLFDLTLAVVQETERHVLTFRSAGTIVDAVIRTIFYPLPFIRIGMAELFRPASTWAAISLGLLIAAAFLSKHFVILVELNNYVLLACTYLPLFLMIFAVPSTFAFDSIKGQQIQSLADYIYSIGIDCEEKIEVFEENISNVAKRTYARVKAFQWLVATVWALFLYGLNQVNGLAVKIAPEHISKTMSDSMIAFAIYGAIALFSVLLIVSYKKGNDAVFRRLMFAVQELRFRMIVQQPVVGGSALPQSQRMQDE